MADNKEELSTWSILCHAAMSGGLLPVMGDILCTKVIGQGFMPCLINLKIRNISINNPARYDGHIDYLLP